jgi:hypothetical protein
MESANVPRGEAVFLDHLAHWVPDIRAAAAVLDRLGFVATPYAEHAHRRTPGEPPEPAGTGNHCVMLDEGYLEILSPTVDTPVAREVRQGLARHTGLHLTAFVVADAEAHRERLVAQGFPQRPCVHLEREIATESGEMARLRFSVVRPEPGCLAEGRVQFLSHHTPELLWQSRWLEHPNTARGLTDMLFCVSDPEEARQRYERYLGRPAEVIAGGCLFRLERGRLALLGVEAVRVALPESPVHRVPYMAAYGVACDELNKTRAVLKASGIDYRSRGTSQVCVSAPPALGGVVVFGEIGDLPPWLDLIG